MTSGLRCLSILMMNCSSVGNIWKNLQDRSRMSMLRQCERSRGNGEDSKKKIRETKQEE